MFAPALPAYTLERLDVLLVLDRFLAKFEEVESGCHQWTACTSAAGYGRFNDGKRIVFAHRYAWEAAHGKIEDDLVIDHLCRNRACVNVEHLRAVTRRENTMAPGSLAFQKMYAERTHCGNGHELSDDNLVQSDLKRDNRRRCAICTKESWKKGYHRRKAAK
jgi:hypothetical protein